MTEPPICSCHGVVSDVLLQEQLRDRMLDLAVLKPPRVWKP